METKLARFAQNWNVGMMESWGKDDVTRFGILDCWINGNNRVNDKILNGYYPLKNPLFHHSTIPSFHGSGINQKLLKDP
jgi:hypothetical protein